MAIFTVLSLSLTWDVASELIFFVRVTRFPNIGSLYTWIQIASLTAIGIASFAAFALVTTTAIRIDRLQIFSITLAFGLLAEGILIGLHRGHSFDLPFASQIYYWLNMTLGFCVGFGSSYREKDIEALERLVARFCVLLVIATWAGIVALEVVRITTGAAFYIGYPSEQLLLPLAHYGQRRRWLVVLLILITFALTGKRGPLVASAFMLIYFIAMGHLRRSLIPAAVIALSLSMLPSVVSTMENHGWVSEDSLAGRAVHKWKITFEYATTDATIASSGRNLEIQYAMPQLDRPLDWFLGLGYGWSFHYPDDESPYHFVHLSYLNYVMTYGVAGAGLLFSAIAAALLAIWRNALVAGSRPLLQMIPPFLGGCLLTAFTDHLLGIYLVFWIFLGLGLQLAIRRNITTE